MQNQNEELVTMYISAPNNITTEELISMCMQADAKMAEKLYYMSNDASPAEKFNYMQKNCRTSIFE